MRPKKLDGGEVSDLIDRLTALNEKWPGLFSFVAMANGYDVNMSFSELQELNTKLICDDAGMDVFRDILGG